MHRPFVLLGVIGKWPNERSLTGCGVCCAPKMISTLSSRRALSYNIIILFDSCHMIYIYIFCKRRSWLCFLFYFSCLNNFHTQHTHCMYMIGSLLFSCIFSWLVQSRFTACSNAFKISFVHGIGSL